MHAHGITRRALDSDSKGRLVLAEGQTVLLMDTLGFLGPGAVTTSVSTLAATSVTTAVDKNADRSHICALSKVCHCVCMCVVYSMYVYQLCIAQPLWAVGTLRIIVSGCCCCSIAAYVNGRYLCCK
jgi:hypothetical protein